MRFILNFVLTVLFGVCLATAAAASLEVLFPSLSRPVFLAIVLWWFWNVWRYARVLSHDKL